jgi:hypothetical protein
VAYRCREPRSRYLPIAILRSKVRCAQPSWRSVLAHTHSRDPGGPRMSDPHRASIVTAANQHGTRQPALGAQMEHSTQSRASLLP